MKHIHLESCQSTQKHLIELYEETSKPQIVSCETQTLGVGRGSNTWHSFPNTICFSFTFTPSEILTLTSLEVGALVAKFFENKFNIQLKLKWPNDILNSKNQKVGGIILHKGSGRDLVIGIGLNLFEDQMENKSFDYPHGFISDQPFEYSKKKLINEIVSNFNKNRIKIDFIPKAWSHYCAHLNSEVEMLEGDKVRKGFFKGLGQNGQALIKIKNEIIEFYSATLRF